MKHLTVHNNRVVSRVFKVTFCGFVAAAASGCAASEATEEDVTDIIDVSDPSSEFQSGANGSEDAGGFRQIEQKFSIESCAEASADQTFTGKIVPKHVSPRSYDTCYKGYVVDLENIAANMTGPGVGGGSPARIVVGYADSTITSKSTCEDTELRVVVYTNQLSNGDWDDNDGVYDAKKFGSWVSELVGIGANGEPITEKVCALSTNITGMSAGSSYRMAVTSRTAGSTRKVAFQTHPQIVLR